MRDRTDWKLNPLIFQKINNHYGPLEVDLFASRLSARCPLYFSWRPDPYALATDAFIQNWANTKCYAASTSRPCLQDTTMVPNSTSHAHRLPSVDNSGTRSSGQQGSHAPTSSVSRMAHLRKKFRDQTFLKKLQHSCSNHGEPKQTNRMTPSSVNGIRSWCIERSYDPFSGPITNVVNFLAYLFKEGYQYSSINSYRSAISSVHEKVEGHNVGQHPLVTRLLKGIFHDRPPLPRYSGTWNVQNVLNYLEGLGENKFLPLKLLSWKLTMLLALTRPSRSADLSHLDLSRRT